MLSPIVASPLMLVPAVGYYPAENLLPWAAEVDGILVVGPFQLVELAGSTWPPDLKINALEVRLEVPALKVHLEVAVLKLQLMSF